MSRPLEGVRVLDFSTLLPGPLATLVLAEAGAEVIKVERPPGGDDMRREDADFAMLNRGKLSIAVDLKSREQRARLLPLIERADVVVEQFRPGVMDRLGLGWSALAEVNPRLIYCSINGYGADGPKAQAAGHDLTYAAEAGLLSQTQAADGAPGMPPTLVGDIGAGAYPAVINILLALIQRDRTGVGAQIEISMYDNLFPFLYPAIASAYGRGHWPLPGDALETGASPRYNLYRTADDRFIAAAPAEEKFWRGFCEAIDLPSDLVDSSDWAAVRQGVANCIRERTAQVWEQIFARRDVACAVVKTFEEAVLDPHFRAREILSDRVQYGRDLPALPVPVVRAFRGPSTGVAAPLLNQDADLLGSAP